MISNISLAQTVVAERIHTLIPDNAFEFIITSSNYIFRKPHRRIFELALEKAGLPAEDVWYIGTIDLPYEEHKEIFTIKDWSELSEKLSVL